VRRNFAAPDVDRDFARAGDLAREASAVLLDAGAIEHVQLVFARRAEGLAALANDHAARGAGKLAAAIVRQRGAALQQAVQEDFAFAQRHGEMVHIDQTLRSVERSDDRDGSRLALFFFYAMVG
jgi:hypothetical protein